MKSYTNTDAFVMHLEKSSKIKNVGYQVITLGIILSTAYACLLFAILNNLKNTQLSVLIKYNSVRDAVFPVDYLIIGIIAWVMLVIPLIVCIFLLWIIWKERNLAYEAILHIRGDK